MSRVYITGQRFGKLLVLEYVRGSRWRCRCDCGNESIVNTSCLTTGHTRSCGCLKKTNGTKHILNLTGKRFGRLIAVCPCGRDNHGNVLWKCRCDCGGENTVTANGLGQGNTRSCGCLRKDNFAMLCQLSITHGMSKTPTYSIYCGIKKRCYDKHTRAYKNYGARGIKVCERWLGTNGFQHFLADIGQRPSPAHSVGRRNNDGDYEPANCQWVTGKSQARNRRNTRYITFDGLRLSISDWADKTGIPASTIHARVFRQKWTVERALTDKTRLDTQ